MQRNTLVTGATGMVGYCIAQSLLKRGHRVRALVRSMEKGRRLLPPACELVVGDVTQPETLGPAVAGCDWVFHAAGFPEQWMKDPGVFDRVNAEGTAHMLAAARQAEVRRFVFTSTIDVFTWHKGRSYDESELDPKPKATAYERSKQRADRLVQSAVEAGMDAVYLHPAGVYGPAPSESAGTNDLILKVWKKQVPMLLPGGYPLVYGPDVGEGHVLAAERGACGSRFILSEGYYELTALVREILRQLGVDQKPPAKMPLWVASTVSAVGETWSNLSGKPPLIPKGQLQFLQVDAYPVATRATEQLGLRFTSLPEGLAQTIDWMRATGQLSGAR